MCYLLVDMLQRLKRIKTLFTRTLDRFHYYMIENIAYRDHTQVVSRWYHKLAGRLDHSKRGTLDHPNHNILMVDQLWLWKIPKGDKFMSDTIVTCFPRRHEAFLDNIDDIRDRVIPESAKYPIRTTDDLIDRILSACTDIFEPNDIESLQFLRFFDSAIGTVVSFLR